jgi:uncharacterized protein (DUF2267 family)
MKLLPHRKASEPAVRDVFALLVHHCDPGETANLIAQIPGEPKELWSEGARTFQEKRQLTWL